LQRPLLGVALVVLLMLGLKTAHYIPVFRSDVAVAENAYVLYPDWNATSFNLAVALIEAADFKRVRILLDSEPELSRPAWVPDYLLGWMALEEGRVVKAVPFLQRSFWLAIDGGYFPYAALPLARAYRSMGNEWQALRVLEQVLESRIFNPLDYYRAKKLREEIILDIQKARVGN
jgi:tetratricopeptide (TPR) repeat protein